VDAVLSLLDCGSISCHGRASTNLEEAMLAAPCDVPALLYRIYDLTAPA